MKLGLFKHFFFFLQISNCVFFVKKNPPFINIKIGIKTDTFDASGKILKQVTDFEEFSDTQLEQVLQEFRGAITQITPIYSAVKVKGEYVFFLFINFVTIKLILKKYNKKVEDCLNLLGVVKILIKHNYQKGMLSFMN